MQRHDSLYMIARTYAGDTAVTAIHQSSPSYTDHIAALLKQMRLLSLC